MSSAKQQRELPNLTSHHFQHHAHCIRGEWGGGGVSGVGGRARETGGGGGRDEGRAGRGGGRQKEKVIIVCFQNAKEREKWARISM